jgi:hypothetical protein
VLSGLTGLSAPRSPSRSSRTKSGLAVPPPEPAKSGQTAAPSAPRVPPNPKGDIAASAIRPLTDFGCSMAYCMTTPDPADHPSRSSGTNKPMVSIRPLRSSDKSRIPRVASMGLCCDPPYPRRSGAIR